MRLVDFISDYFDKIVSQHFLEAIKEKWFYNLEYEIIQETNYSCTKDPWDNCPGRNSCKECQYGFPIVTKRLVFPGLKLFLKKVKGHGFIFNYIIKMKLKKSIFERFGIDKSIKKIYME